jgi:aspartyl-tRNA(Asn)/glutamyl-tRNA(Gln) amidotransferase subunit A
MNELAWLPLVEVATLIRERRLSPIEYAEALYAHANRIDPQINAYLRLTRETAMEEAHRAEEQIIGGTYYGAMHGMPYGLKDIIDYAGVPTTAHSRLLSDNVPSRDASVTSLLKRAGGVMLGKLATHEFAFGGPSFDLPWPPARNPWNRKHFPGGSSSGSGAAVAAGFMPMALGTDTAGSIRNPASMCGVVGMKPTYGRVSRSGVLPLAFSLDTIGPLTRTVEDNALVLNIIAGHDVRDAASIRSPRPDFTSDLRRGVKGLRIGVIRHFYTRDMQADLNITSGVEDAIGVLESLGAEVSEIELRPLEMYSDCCRTILLSEAYSVHERWLRERPSDYGALARQRLLAGAFIRAVDYVHATRLRARLVHEFDEAMSGIDVAVTVSSMDPPGEIEDLSEMERTYPRNARNVFNVIGSPALSLPVGFTPSGLPLSMQIVAPAYKESTIYRVAFAYEEATNWTSRRPALE